MTVYYRAGGWDAFSGPGDNGKPVCGVGTTNPADNRSFSLRFQIGGDTVTFQAKKPTWNIPAGTQLPVVLQIGLDTPWNLQGVGNGQVVEWSLDRDAMQTFDAQFRRANSMTVTFPVRERAALDHRAQRLDRDQQRVRPLHHRPDATRGEPDAAVRRAGSSPRRSPSARSPAAAAAGGSAAALAPPPSHPPRRASSEFVTARSFFIMPCPGH